MMVRLFTIHHIPYIIIYIIHRPLHLLLALSCGHCGVLVLCALTAGLVHRCIFHAGEQDPLEAAGVQCSGGTEGEDSAV